MCLYPSSVFISVKFIWSDEVVRFKCVIVVRIFDIRVFLSSEFLWVFDEYESLY